MNDFKFEILDYFFLPHTGCVVSGNVISGKICIHDYCYIQYRNGEKKESKIIGIQSFKKKKDYVAEGESAALILDVMSTRELKNANYITALIK